MSQGVFAGAAEVNITPPPGLLMDGYMARDAGSLGTHDPLMAQVLILRHDHQTLVLVALDILAVTADFTNPLRHTLAAILNTVPDAVMICPSHTHCGPRGLQSWFPMGNSPALDMPLVAFIHDRLAAAAQTALNQLEPVRLIWRMGTVQNIGGNRNQPHAPVDQQVTTLACERMDGRVICLLLHYACHPTVLGADTRYYSADFVGAARQRLQAVHPTAVCLFLNGALGDMSTRFNRRSQSFDEVERMGGLLADAVVASMKQAQPPDPIHDLAWETRHLELPFRNFDEAPLPVLMNADPSNRVEQTRAEGSLLQTQLKQALRGCQSQSAALTRFKIGSWHLFGIPGEPFNQLAVSIRTALPQALVVGLANDYAGYFPTQSAIDAQTYEALSSPYDARALNLIQQALLNQ